MSNRIKPVNPANQFTVLTFAEAKQPEYKEKKAKAEAISNSVIRTTTLITW